MSAEASAAAGSPAARLWQLRRRVLLLFLPWPLLLVPLGLASYYNLRAELRQPREQQQQELLSRGVQVISRSLISLRRDVRLLSNMPAMQDAVSGGPRTPLAGSFARFASATEYYDQVRWIDINGTERVRVDYRGNTARIVPDAELQDKASRPYYYNAVLLPPGEIYVSPLDLNVEHGEIELPHRPTLRLATAVSDAQGGRAGVLVLNYQANILMRRLLELSGDSGMDVQLINRDGYWLFGARAEDDFAFMLGHPERQLPMLKPELWEAMLLQQTGWADDEGAWLFRRIAPVAEIMGREPLSTRPEPHWYLAVHRPLAMEQAQETRLAIIIGGLTTLALLFALWLAARISFYEDDRERGLALLERRKAELTESNAALQNSLNTLHAVQDELIRAEKLSSLGLMVAGVAHELNTPLGSALVSLSSLQQRLDALETQLAAGLRRSDLDRFMQNGKEMLGLADESLQRAAELVRRFKQLAVDRSTMERRPFLLSEVIEDSLHLWLRKRPANTPHIVVDIPPDLQLDSYPGPMGQIVSNLVGNALKHAFPDNPGAGTITVRAHRQEKSLQLTVSDDGCGMDAATQARAFDLFFTTRRNQGGTGLGLYMAHQLAREVLGGRLELVTAPGKGAHFTLTVPLIAPEVPRTDAPPVA